MDGMIRSITFCVIARPPRPRFCASLAGGMSDDATRKFVYAGGMPRRAGEISDCGGAPPATAQEEAGPELMRGRHNTGNAFPQKDM
jgi:hypothetical protein